MRVFSIAASLIALVFSTIVLADEEGSFTSYDAIVNELKASADEKPPTASLHEDYDWQETAVHAGVGLATSWVSVTAPGGAAGSGLMKGFTANVGMNLFSRWLRAEGAFSEYASEELDPSLHADLKEFELSLVALPRIQDNTVLRFGVGLAARYMSINAQSGGGQWVNSQASTPTSVLLAGFERNITPSIAVGPDISYRSAMVSDTFDKSSWDASLRLNATF